MFRLATPILLNDSRLHSFALLQQKHPHVIFEARTKANKGCANSGNLEWRMKNYRRQKHLSGVTDTGGDTEATQRTKRDVREATKYIETAMVIDKAMFDKRNGSTRAEVVHDAIQVANIADLYFRTLNTRVSVVYIETWQGSNQAQILKTEDISRSLLNFNDYTSRKLFKIDKDTTQLLTYVYFVYWLSFYQLYNHKSFVTSQILDS